MPGYIEAGRWDEVARDMKLHILGWKYYYFDEIKKTLVNQSNRIYEKLKELDEDDGIAAAVGDRNGAFDKAYIPQGLAAL
jgi:gas vesicle protein